MKTHLERFLSRINAVFIGDDKDLARLIKIACAKTKIHSQSLNKSLNLSEFNCILVEIQSEQSLEFIEDITYENPHLKIIAIEPKSLERSFDDDFIAKAFAVGVFTYLPNSIDERSLKVCLTHFACLFLSDSTINLSENIAVNQVAQELYFKNKPLFLSPKLRKIFWLLLNNKNKVVSHYTIIEFVDENMSISSLRMAIMRLKRVLKNKDFIVNVSGEGYMLVC